MEGCAMQGAAAWSATAMRRSDRSRPGSARSRCAGRGRGGQAHPFHLGGAAAGLPAAHQEHRGVIVLAVSEGDLHARSRRRSPSGWGRTSPAFRRRRSAARWRPGRTSFSAGGARDLSAKRYLDVWADGVCFAPRREHDRQCILVLARPRSPPAGEPRAASPGAGLQTSGRSGRQSSSRGSDHCSSRTVMSRRTARTTGAEMAFFTRSPHQSRLYVADPSEGEAGWIGDVLPKGGEDRKRRR